MATKEESTPMFNIHSTTGKSPSMEATEFAVQIITMNKSLYVWIGSADARSQRMDNLTAALTSRSSATTSSSTSKPRPSVATIFEGGVADDASVFAEGLAERICQRTGQVAFVSYNLPVTSTPDEALMFEVEKVTSGLIKTITSGAQQKA